MTERTFEPLQRRRRHLCAKVAGIYGSCSSSTRPRGFGRSSPFASIRLLGTGFLAYSFGLRHAVDADHIAAIDT